MVFMYGCSNSVQVQGYSMDCVVVIWDNEVNIVWIRVGINDSKYWNIQVVCFFDSNVFVVSIDYKQSVWQIVYVFDIVQVVFQFFQFMSVYQCFFFGQFVESIVLRLSFQVFQMFDGLMNGFLVSQYIVQLVMVYEELVVVQSSVFYCFVCSVFSINEKDFIFVRSNFVQFSQSFVEYWYSFFKVDDVNFVTCIEDEWFYFWVLVMGLVIEVNISFEYVVYGNSCYD